VNKFKYVLKEKGGQKLWSFARGSGHPRSGERGMADRNSGHDRHRRCGVSKVIVLGRELSDAEVRQMDRSIERVVDDVHFGRPEKNAKKAPDPYEINEHERDFLKGRDADPTGYWRQVMEYHGFVWLEPEQLNRMVGRQKYVPSTLDGLHDRFGRDVPNSRLYWTRPHTVGQWRYVPGSGKAPHPALRRCAFTMADLVALYRDSPAEFDRWAKETIEKWRRKRLGLRR
jgi:hypothetical protein